MDKKDKSTVECGQEHNFDEDCTFKISDWGTRHKQCIVLFFALTIAYSIRTCMGVALVAMVSDGSHLKDMNHTSTGNQTNDTVSSSELADEDFETHGILNTLLLIPPFPKFNWNKKTQDTILASFFFGYMSLQIPAGQLAHRFGARKLLAGSLMLNGAILIIMPAAVYYGGWVCALICRIVMGMGQACVMPGMHTYLGKWAPLEERGRMTAFIYGGQAIGTVLGLPTTGFIASSYVGWPGIFRFYGLLSGIICVILWFLMADSPAQHKGISMAERMYIEQALGQTNDMKKLPVPWKKIFKSRGMWAIIAAHIGNTWGQLTLFSELPSFMDKVMGVNIKANGLLTALPFLVMWFTNFFFSWLTDMLIVKNYLSVTNTRKLANSLGCIPSAIGLVVLAYAPKNIYVVETILVIVCGFKIAAHVGFHVNHVDIAPNFAGTMMSISNFASNGFGSLAPIVAGLILTDPSDPRLWRQVFFVAAGLYMTMNLIYVIFGTGELAEWNDPQYEKVPLNDQKKDKKDQNSTEVTL